MINRVQEPSFWRRIAWLLWGKSLNPVQVPEQEQSSNFISLQKGPADWGTQLAIWQILLALAEKVTGERPLYFDNGGKYAFKGPLSVAWWKKPESAKGLSEGTDYEERNVSPHQSSDTNNC